MPSIHLQREFICRLNQEKEKRKREFAAQIKCMINKMYPNANLNKFVALDKPHNPKVLKTEKEEKKNEIGLCTNDK